MNKKGLYITLVVAVVIASVAYIAGSVNKNNDKVADELGQPIAYSVDQDLTSKIEVGSQADDFFVIESDQNVDSETAAYIYETVKGKKELTEFNATKFISLTTISAFENGYLFQESKHDTISEVTFYDYFGSTAYTLFDVPLQHDESLQSLQLSLKNDAIYASYVQEYSPTNYQNGYSDQIVNTRILKYDFGSETISQVFSYSDSGNAVSVVAAAEEYLVLVHYSTVINQTSYFTYDFASRKETSLKLNNVRATVISPDKSQLLFIQSTDLAGSFKAKDLKLFSITAKDFISVDFTLPSLSSTGLDSWPNYSVLQDVVWSKNSQELVFLKSTFSNGDIDNATIDILDMNLANGEVKDVSTFRTEVFSAQGLLGKIDNTIYISGAVDGVTQLRSYPDGTLLYQIDIPGWLVYSS